MKGGNLHHRTPNLTDQRFGMLTALRPGTSDGRKRKWHFRCDCGNTCEKVGADVTKETKRGGTPNCGCASIALQSKARTTHGMTRHPAYAVWRSLSARCCNPRHAAWDNYGGRGIKVCSRWRTSFQNFWDDMGPSYQPGMDLDRINNDGHYEPLNCRWVDRREGNNNRRTNRLIKTPWGQMTISQAARKSGINATTLLYRIDNGWPTKDLFRAPAFTNRYGTSKKQAHGTGS